DQRRVSNQDCQRQTQDGTNFEEGGQVVTRGQQQPYRQYGRNKAVSHQPQGQLLTVQVEQFTPVRMCCNVLTVNQCCHQHDKANNRDFAYTARTQNTQINTHEQGDRDGHRQGEHTPRAANQRFNHDHAQYGEQNDQNGKDTDQTDDTGNRSHFPADHLTKGSTTTSGGEEHN